MLCIINPSSKLDSLLQLIQQIVLYRHLRDIVLVCIRIELHRIIKLKKEEVHTALETTKQRPDDLAFIRCAHEHTETTAHRTRRSSIAVNVYICGARDLVVYDMVNSRDIKTTSCDVSSQQN